MVGGRVTSWPLCDPGQGGHRTAAVVDDDARQKETVAVQLQDVGRLVRRRAAPPVDVTSSGARRGRHVGGVAQPEPVSDRAVDAASTKPRRRRRIGRGGRVSKDSDRGRGRRWPAGPVDASRP